MKKSNEKIVREILEKETSIEENKQNKVNIRNGFLAGAIGAIVGYKYL